MDDERKKIIERIAKAFPSLESEQKAYLAGYIARTEEEQVKKQKTA